MTDSLLIQGKDSSWDLTEELKAANIKPADKTIRYEQATSTISYVGIAVVGSSGASAVWQIKRITNSTVLSIEWADGNNLFDNIWNNRAALSYS